MTYFKLGKFLLLKRINSGGMAEVFLAKTTGFVGMERLTAVKRILPKVASNEEFVRMFVDEAKLAVLLNHASVAHTYELGRHGGTYYIAMEFVDGKDLRAIFDRCRVMNVFVPIPIVCQIIASVCDGLDYAHHMTDPAGKPLNIVHRDISPQNIIVGYDGRVKIIDFGVAKAAIQSESTKTGILKGKLGYMPPEQVRNTIVDKRGDIFSAGIVLWELLTNKRLFKHKTEFHVLEYIRQCEIYPPRAVNPKIPEALEKIVLRALHSDPVKRYQTAGEMHEDLLAFIIKNYNVVTSRLIGEHVLELFEGEYERERRIIEELQAIDEKHPDIIDLGRRVKADKNGRLVVQTQMEHDSQQDTLQDREVTQTVPEVIAADYTARADQDGTTNIQDPDFPNNQAAQQIIQQHQKEEENRSGWGIQKKQLLLWIGAVSTLLVLLTAVLMWTGNPRKSGRLVVISEPSNVRFMVDDEMAACVTPCTIGPLPVGVHRLKFFFPKQDPISRDVEVVYGQLKEIQVKGISD